MTIRNRADELVHEHFNDAFAEGLPPGRVLGRVYQIVHGARDEIKKTIEVVVLQVNSVQPGDMGVPQVFQKRELAQHVIRHALAARVHARLLHGQLFPRASLHCFEAVTLRAGVKRPALQVWRFGFVGRTLNEPVVCPVHSAPIRRTPRVFGAGPTEFGIRASVPIFANQGHRIEKGCVQIEVPQAKGQQFVREVLNGRVLQEGGTLVNDRAPYRLPQQALRTLKTPPFHVI